MWIKEKLTRNDIFYRNWSAARLIVNQFSATASKDPNSTPVSTLISEHDSFAYLHYALGTNFGDALSPIVFEMLSGKKSVSLAHNLAFPSIPAYSVIGSVLQFQANSKTEVWGSGFITASRKMYWKPRKIHAVRGPLSRQKCLHQGFECPEIFGDPAVIYFDKFKQSKRPSEFKLGVIPHYADYNHPGFSALKADENVLFIDVLDPPNVVVENALKCSHIVSSSLHGLIMADALEIPNRWIGVSDLVMKGGFKFQDYFESVGRKEEEPLWIDDLTVTKALQQTHLRNRPFDREILLSVCPFLRR